jgi:dCMP deaminase
MKHWNWDEYFINMAYLVATKSRDPSTQVGSVVVGPNHEVRSTGYNGLCRGEDDDNESFYARPLKYAVVEHSERNSIYNMARVRRGAISANHQAMQEELILREMMLAFVNA